MNNVFLALIGAATLAALGALAHRQAIAARPETGDWIDLSTVPETTESVATPAPVASAWDSVDLWGYTTAAIENRQVTNAMTAPDTSGQNVAAFLSMIASSEGTDRAADPYRVCFGYQHTIADLRDHPAITGEWKGEKLPDATCQGAGMRPGCVSTAAGRYQIIKPTWAACARALGLSDFTPASQDAAALYLVKQRGALDDVQGGRVADAIGKCRREWASLPGAGYGQPERRLTALLDTFTNAGGNLA